MLGDPGDHARSTIARSAVMEVMAFLATTMSNLDDTEVGKGHPSDFSTAFDIGAEQIVARIVRDRFPRDSFDSEETPRYTDGEVAWIVDPLDGTNNFVHGLPLWGSAITITRDGHPVAAVSQSTLDRLPLTSWSAVPRPIATKPAEARLSLALIQPYGALGDESAIEVRRVLELHTRRTLSTWAPTVDLSLLLRGRLDAIVSLGGLGHEMHAVHFIAAAAGMASYDLTGSACPPSPSSSLRVIARPDVVSSVLDLIPVGLALRGAH